MGSAGEPEERAGYVALEAEGAHVYLAPVVWERAIQDGGRLRALMPGYGMACLRFEQPIADEMTRSV